MTEKNLIRMPLRAHLGSAPYDIAYLGSDYEKGDFYYHFCYPKLFEDWALNIESEHIGFRPDHISWHSDGTVHIKCKGPGEIIPLGKCGESLLDCPPTTFTPLLIDSIYWNFGYWDLPPSNKLSLQGWNFSEVENFSILLFLIHNTRSPSQIFNNYGFSRFWKSFTRMFRFEGFRDWSVIAVLSNYVLPRPDPLVINCSDAKFQGITHYCGRSYQLIDLHIHYQRLINPERSQLLITHQHLK